MAAAEAPTKVPASIKENSCRSKADCIKCNDHATRATSNMRIGVSILCEMLNLLYSSTHILIFCRNIINLSFAKDYFFR